MATTFENWKLGLLEIIKREAKLSDSEISLPRDLHDLYYEGHSPEQVFFTCWNQDAGHYYKIDL